MEHKIDEKEIQVSFEKIVKVKCLGSRQTYDLEMSEKRKNYVAQNMIVHNSHASSYGVIAYITAWLKIYYPAEFMTALLSHNVNDDDKLAIYVRESKRLGLKFLKPNINLSSEEFVHKKGKIRYPLSIIKRVGEKSIKDIFKQRENGRFEDFDDFYNRINKRVTNVGVIQNLIFAGCFKKFGTINQIYNRLHSIRGKDRTIRVLYCSKCDRKYPVSYTEKHVDENGVFCPECGSKEVNTNFDLIKKKRFNLGYCNGQIYGFSVDNPLKKYLEKFIEYNVTDMKEAVELDGSSMTVGGIVVSVRKHIDKNGNEMAFVSLSDGNEVYDLIIFSSLWCEYSDILKKKAVYIFKVKCDNGKFLLRKAHKGASLKRL